MDYHTEYIDYKGHIKRIYHISDIHINLQSKHDEYRYVFNNLYTFLKEEKRKYNIPIETNKDIECCIVITGDILHSKTELMPECIEITRDFLTKCAELMPTIMIAGNHDMNVNNKERLDALTPIRNGIREELPLYYLKESGLYYFNNIVWSHAAVQDYLIIDPTKIQSTNKKKICLFHGRVNGVILFNKTKISGETIKKTNKTITPESFKGYDYTLMGDIHKHQYLDKEKTMAYSGSLIQQNHGETINGHGILVWDIENNTSHFQEITNDYCFYTHKVKNSKISNEDVELIQKKLKKTHIRLRLQLDNTPFSKLQEIIALFKNNFNVLEVNYQDCSNGNQSDIKKEITMNITNIDYQNKLIEEYLKRYTSTTDKNIEYIKKLNEISNKQLEENDMWLNSRWKLIKLEFSNLFSYGEDNIINFKDYKGILGIIAPNHMGKSAIIDIILFTLYDKFPRKGNVKDIVNNRKNNFKSKIIFKIGSWRYVVIKQGNKTDKGRVSSKIEFYRINRENIKEILTEETVVKTKNAILKYVGLYEDIIQTNVSLQNNNCNFIEAENTARKRELERILQVDFISVLQKKSNIIISDKKAIYKHLQNNCYEESILQLNKNISQCVTDLKENDIRQRNLKQQLSQLETIITNKVTDLIPNIETEMDKYKNKLGNNPNETLKQLEDKFKIVNENKVFILLDVMRNEENDDMNNERNEFKRLHKMKNNELETYKRECEDKHRKVLKKKEETINKYNIDIENLISNIKHPSVYDNTKTNSYNQNIYKKNKEELEKSKKTIKILLNYGKQLKIMISTIEEYKELINNKKDFITKCNEETLPIDIITLLEEEPIYELKEELKTENSKLNNFIKGENKNKKYTIKDLEKYRELYKNTSIYEYLEEYQSQQEDKCFKKEEYVETIKTLDIKMKEENNKINKIIQILQNENNIKMLSCNKTINHNEILIKLNKNKLNLENKIGDVEKWITDYKDDILIKTKNKEIEKQIEVYKEKRTLINEKCDEEYDTFIKYYNSSQKVKQYDSEITIINNEIEAINKNINDYRDIENKYKKNELNKKEINEMRKQLEFIKEEDKKIEFKLNVGKTEFTRNNTKLDEHKKEIERMKDIEKELNIYTVYNEALKNLPFIIIKKVVPRLESKINELLSVCTNFVVKVQVDNNHIDIYIDRPIYNGRLILLNNASGFERFISSLAIRLALLDISQLPKPNFIAIDEGWTSFDYHNINNVRTIFDFLVEKFDFVLSISHLSQIKEHCSNQIHLKKNDKGYSIIV